MKHFIFLAFISLVSLSFLQLQKKIENIITVSETSLSFNQNESFTLPASPKDLEQVLGKSTFHNGSSYSMYSWDSLGLTGLVRKEDSMVYSFEINFSEFDFNETPKLYSGVVQILNHSINKETSRKAFINSYNGQITDTTDFMPEFKIGRYTVVAEFNEDSDVIIGLGISE